MKDDELPDDPLRGDDSDGDDAGEPTREYDPIAESDSELEPELARSPEAAPDPETVALGALAAGFGDARSDGLSDDPDGDLAGDAPAMRAVLSASGPWGRNADTELGL